MNIELPKSAIHTCAQLTELVDRVGFLPLLRGRVAGWSAEDVADAEAQYIRLPEGGWVWKLWEWKSEVLRESGCAYGKFFARKAGYISREWWPDFCNYRRSRLPAPCAGSVEEMLLLTLRESGSMLARDLRRACGFTGKMRSQFDTYVARLEMSCHVVTDDFVTPRDRHGRPYGWGWAVLTTPEQRFSRRACHPERTPEQSRELLLTHLAALLPKLSRERLLAVLG